MGRWDDARGVRSGGRAVCPSCGGRRMAERAAHLVDHVIPDVPVRQWVLSLPRRLRYRLAWNRDVCRRVTTVLLSTVFRLLRDHARADGLEQPRGGGVAIVQRFGGALNLNVHIHALVLDGVFARDGAGPVAFHPARRLTTLDVAEVLAAVGPRLRRLLGRSGGPEGDHERQSIPGWRRRRHSPGWRRRRCRGGFSRPSQPTIRKPAAAKCESNANAVRMRRSFINTKLTASTADSLRRSGRSM